MLASMGGVLEGASDGLTVLATNVTYTTTRPSGGTSTAGIRFNSTNSIQRCGADGVFDIDVDNPYVFNGDTSDVWMARNITSGSLTTDEIGNNRVTCNANYVMKVVDANISVGSQASCEFTVNFYDAATDGNLLESCTYDITTNYTNL